MSTLNNKKANVMLVINSVGGAGAELVVSNLCRHINTNRFNISVCHLKDRGEKGEELLRQGYDIVGLPGKDRTNYLDAFKLRQLVLQREIDLFHSHDMGGLFNCASCKLITPRIKVIHTYHFGNYPHLPIRYLLLEGFFSRVADKLVAVGYNQKRRIEKTYRMKPERIQTIYNGIVPLSMAKTDYQKKPSLPSDPTVIGSLCTFLHQKGVDYLLQVAQVMKNRKQNVVFWVVGDGPLRPQLENQKHEMGLDEIVKFLGWIPNAAEILLPNMDIFLQTSRWEAMSMVILEAMAASKPIVATDVGENRNVIESAGAGFIVSPGDVSSTVCYLEELTSKTELRLKMGELGEKAVLNQYTAARMTRQYEALYAQILGLPE